MKSITLSEIISVKQRFGRSVNLERDFYSRVSLEGYVVTTTARQSFGRLLQACSNKTTERAFTLTGPYGSGKSTFALFAAKVFDVQDKGDGSPAAQILRENAGDLWSAFKDDIGAPKFLPILISGSREALAPAILRGVKSALEHTANSDLRAIVTRIKALEKGKAVTGKQLVKLFREISETLNAGRRKQPCGLLVVIDELGKLLEHAAIRPDESDIFILQELAEAAKSFERPFFLITILHQAFQRYAERLGRRERDEWMKIQGRFEDLAFQEPNEQVLHILQNAFEVNEELPEAKQLKSYGKRLAEDAFKLGLCGSFKKTACSDLLRDCMPLHPTAALTLGHVFRRFGQNERSLFAFLTSSEAFGLNDFLRNNLWDKNAPDSLRLDRVYDYLVSALGSSLYAGPESQKWAEIDTALHRLAEPTEVEVRLIKVVGLLGLLGSLGNLKSSREVLQFALEGSETTKEQIDRAIGDLQEQSVLIERRFNDTFAIWEGSDADLDARFREAEKHINPNASLAENLTENFEARPLIAKRHSEDTGTLRFFEIAYTDPDNLEATVGAPFTEAEGRIVYVLTGNEAERTEVVERIESLSVPASIVIAVPQNLANLREAVFNVACWHWVGRNTPELENDRSARTELNARLYEAAARVSYWLNNLQTDTTQENCRWFWNNREIEIPNPRSLQTHLSDVFDGLFNQAAVLKNELINRRNLSSAATSARRVLFEAMYLHPDKPQLGIEGHPPQLSIYLSILQRTKIHREENGKFGFHPPPPKGAGNTHLVWKRIETFLRQTESSRKTVSEIFKILQGPPFGVRDGVIPILFLAAIVHYESEVALYEHGSFIPKLTLPILERMCKRPETFTVQLCRIGEVRLQVIEKLAGTLLPENAGAGKNRLEMLTLVRPLARFVADIDQFTKLTRRVSVRAQKIRQALIAGREPSTLLFKQLPEACGFDEITSETKLSPADAELLARTLQEGLSEIKRAYPDLLLEIEQMLASAFRIEKGGDDLRSELTRRVRMLSQHAVSPKLKSFILRAGDQDTDFRTWLESLGALLASKPIPMWHDADVAQFEINLTETARSFANLEALAFELKNRKPEDLTGETDFLRLSLTRLGGTEKEEVLSINADEKEKVRLLEETVEEAFKKAGLNGNVKLRLAVLANLSYKLMKSEKD